MKNKAKIVFPIALMLVFGGFIGLAAFGTSDAAADTIPTDAIPVKTPNDLSRIGTGTDFGGYTWSASGYYYLANDIVFDGTNSHIPIGTDAVPFAGTFDGQNYRIIGMEIDGNIAHAALFRTVDGATIKNTIIENMAFNITSSGLVRTGGFVGYVPAAGSLSINNCFVISSTITAESTNNIVFVGGLVGRTETTSIVSISNSGSETEIVARASANAIFAGGIIGRGNSSTISACYNLGNVTSYQSAPSNNIVGGIAGDANTATITETFNAGTITANTSDTGTLSYAGGIVGSVTSVNVTNCYNKGNVTGNNNGTSGVVGGIFGYVGGVSSVINCYNTGILKNNQANLVYVQTGLVFGQHAAGYTGTVVNFYGLIDVLYSNGGLISNILAGRGSITNQDGTSTPPRLGSQSSGAKTAAQLQPNINTAQLGLSVFYTGSTDNPAGTFMGWDFVDVWNIDPSKNGGFPILLNSPTVPVSPGNGGGTGGNGNNAEKTDIALIAVLVLVAIGIIAALGVILGYRRPMVYLILIGSLILATVIAFVTGVFTFGG